MTNAYKITCKVKENGRIREEKVGCYMAHNQKEAIRIAMETYVKEVCYDTIDGWAEIENGKIKITGCGDRVMYSFKAVAA